MKAAMILPDDSLMAWIEEAIGSFQVTSHYAHDHGCSRLWRLQANKPDQAGGQFFWLKCHQYPGKWAGEVHALTHWTPHLKLAAPQVRAYRTEPLAVLLTEMQGTTADATLLGLREEKSLWYAAGAYLARLHTLENEWLGAAHPDGAPQGEKQLDAEEFVRHSIENRLEQGTEQGLFDTAERLFIRDRAPEWTAALRNETPRAIHRDYSPRNWMTEANGQLTGVIDFEHARWDVRAADLNRWWDTDFLGKPALAETFFDGYSGRMPDEKQWAQIQALRLLGAAGGIVWATRVGDAPYVRTNREALHRLMRETSRPFTPFQ
jgi:Ser/Thr protein kinase RdoA (MazF antagonist)